MIENISVVLITRNAGATLAATLDAVRDFTNVVVWDNGSDDDTRDIARRYPNVDLQCGEFHGFGPSKNTAATFARNDWLLSIDADEVVSKTLARSLADWNGADSDTVGEVLRENILMGKVVRRGGWGGDYLIRLYHRAAHRYNDAQVHERVETNPASRIHRLTGTIEHNAVQELGQFLRKVDAYSEIRRTTQTKTYPAPVIFAKAMFAFFRSYVLQLGFLAGWRGLVIAWSDANGVFYKYFKIYAETHASKR